MRQVQLKSFGQPSVVAQWVDVPDVGAPAAWEVVVQIEAFPINVADLAMLAGRYGTLPKLPAPIGMEAVGRVISIGAAVADVMVGDRVVLLGNNNWAEQRKVPAATVFKVPEHLDVHQMSMLKVNPTTALMLLQRFETLEPGDWIIQSAPLGSVGHCVIQLARSMELQTVNVVRRPDAMEQVLNVGGTVALPLSPDLPEKVHSCIGHDRLCLAIDAVAGPQLNLLAQSLNEDGTVVNYGMLSGVACELTPEETIFRNISLRGFWLSKVLNRLVQSERNELYQTVCDAFADGRLNIPIDSVYPAAGLNDALRHAEHGRRHGKVIVDLRT